MNRMRNLQYMENKLKAEINILRTYLESYDMLTDKCMFNRRESQMAYKNASEVKRKIYDKESELRDIQNKMYY